MNSKYSNTTSSSSLPRRSSWIASRKIKDNLSELKNSALSPARKSPETSIPAHHHSTRSGESKDEEVRFTSNSYDCYVSYPSRDSNLLPTNEWKKKKFRLRRVRTTPFGRLLTKSYILLFPRYSRNLHSVFVFLLKLNLMIGSNDDTKS